MVNWWATPSELKNAVREHGSPTAAARKLGGISERRARELWNQLGETASSAASSDPTPPVDADPAEIVALKRKIDRLSEEKKNLERQIKVSVKHANVVDDVAELAAPMLERYPVIASKAHSAKPKRRARRSKPVEIVVYPTDWHAGEQIDSFSVENLNEFNGDVLARRVAHVEQVVAEWVENYQSLHGVSRITYALLGDFVNNNGQLHQDQDNDYARALAQALDASLLLKQLIRPQLGSDHEVRVVTTQGGNHGRSTRKMPSGPSAAQTSWDMVAYEHLAAMLQGSSANMILGRSYSTTIDVAGKKLWIAHGDGVSGGGGQLGIPAYGIKRHATAAERASWVQALASGDLSKVVDYMVVGHFHEPCQIGNVRIAPSIKGTGSWELEKLGKVQKPAQLMQVFHPDHGIIGTHEIDCSNPTADPFVWGAMRSTDPACSLA